MAAEIRSDGTSSRSAAGEIHSALPKLRDQLQSRGRHGATLHRETKRRRSRETLERIREIALIPTPPKRNSKLIRNPGNPGNEERDFRDRRQNCEGSSEREGEPSEVQDRNWNLNHENRKIGE